MRDHWRLRRSIRVLLRTVASVLRDTEGAETCMTLLLVEAAARQVGRVLE